LPFGDPELRHPALDGVGGHNCGEGKIQILSSSTMLSNADNMDSRKIIPFILKVVTRLDRGFNHSSNGIVSEGNESDLEEIRGYMRK
jgi:hypothetical protein